MGAFFLCLLVFDVKKGVRPVLHQTVQQQSHSFIGFCDLLFASAELTALILSWKDAFKSKVAYGQLTWRELVVHDRKETI